MTEPLTAEHFERVMTEVWRRGVRPEVIYLGNGDVWRATTQSKLIRLSDVLKQYRHNEQEKTVMGISDYLGGGRRMLEVKALTDKMKREQKEDAFWRERPGNKLRKKIKRKTLGLIQRGC